MLGKRLWHFVVGEMTPHRLCKREPDNPHLGTSKQPCTEISRISQFSGRLRSESWVPHSRVLYSALGTAAKFGAPS